MGIIGFFEKHSTFEKVLRLLTDMLCRLNRAFFTGREADNKTILVVSLHRIGDTVFTIPVLKCLENIYGQNLTVLCFPESAQVYNLTFNKLNYIIAEKKDFSFGGRIASSIIRKKVRESKPRFIYDITGAVFSVSSLWGVRSGEIYGITNKYLLNFYNKAVIQRTSPHLMDMYFDIVSLTHPNERVEKYREFNCEPVSEGAILIHPFAGWKAKEWNIEKIFSMAEHLSESYDTALIFPRGALQADFLEILKEKGAPYFETGSFNELIEKIKSCSLFVGSDSGPLYIAALLGKPTFTIYSSTNPEYSLQFGRYNRHIIKKLSCSPLPGSQYCNTDGGRDGCPSFNCMNLLETGEVVKKVKEFIKELKIKEKFTYI